MPHQKPLTGEPALIAALSRLFGPAPVEVALGIGDDCAALALAGPDYLLWTMDTLIEGVHFDLAYFSLPQLGRKALAVNLTGPFLCTQAAAPLMRDTGGGAIVNITSISGLRSPAWAVTFQTPRLGSSEMGTSSVAMPYSSVWTVFL